MLNSLFLACVHRLETDAVRFGLGNDSRPLLSAGLKLWPPGWKCVWHTAPPQPPPLLRLLPSLYFIRRSRYSERPYCSVFITASWKSRVSLTDAKGLKSDAKSSRRSCRTCRGGKRERAVITSVSVHTEQSVTLSADMIGALHLLWFHHIRCCRSAVGGTLPYCGFM